MKNNTLKNESACVFHVEELKIAYDSKANSRVVYLR